MRILIVGSYAESLVVFRGDLIHRLAMNGYEVLTCGPDVTPELEQNLIDLGARAVSVPLQRTGLNPFSDWVYYKGLKQVMSNFAPDRVLAYTMKPVIYGSLACPPGISSFSMITGLGYAFARDSLRQRLVGAMVRGLLKRALARNSAVIFQNPDDRDEFLHRGLVAENARTAVVNGSGVDTDFYYYSELKQRSSFLMIARLLEDKGVREYAEAARIVKAQYPDAVFKLAGWLDENPRCIARSELESWTSTGLIEFLGRLDDVRPAIESSAVYVLPSYREGTPRTNLEAMSMGRAIITTDVPGCRETVIDGVNGRLVPARDHEALANAMLKFMDGECDAAEMGREGRKLAEYKYDVHKVNRQVIECMGL